MSKGLGKIQKKILRFFIDEMKKDNFYEYNMINLTRIIHKLGVIEKPSHSKYTSICRAVHSLSKDGYIKIKQKNITKDSKEKYGYLGYHEKRREKLVSIGDRLKREIESQEDLLKREFKSRELYFEWYGKS
ncbi:MAG: hypothetical protein ACTSRI_22070 [Promethearchaeota archaeon]